MQLHNGDIIFVIATVSLIENVINERSSSNSSDDNISTDISKCPTMGEMVTPKEQDDKSLFERSEKCTGFHGLWSNNHPLSFNMTSGSSRIGGRGRYGCAFLWCWLSLGAPVTISLIWFLFHHDFHHDSCDYHWDFMAINYFLNYT